MKASVKVIVLVIMIALIVVVMAATFTLAYWTGGANAPIDGDSAAVVDNDENATTKYLIFVPVCSTMTYEAVGYIAQGVFDEGTFYTRSGTEGNYTYTQANVYDSSEFYYQSIKMIEDEKFCFEYSDANGWVLKYQYKENDYVLEGGVNPAGSRAAASAADISLVNSNVANITLKVVGYIGTLGQFEDLVIPSSISWNSNTLSVTTVDLKMTEYAEPLNLITSVVIPASVTRIDGASFSNANNLSKVYFNNTTVPTIGAHCFRGISPTYYKKSGETYITTTIVRS